MHPLLWQPLVPPLQVLTEDHSEAAVDLLCNHFFKDEPLGKALHLESPREVDHWLSNLLPYLVGLGPPVGPALIRDQ